MNTFLPIDLSQLPAPQVVEQIDYEQILADRKAYAVSFGPQTSRLKSLVGLSLSPSPSPSCCRRMPIAK